MRDRMAPGRKVRDVEQAQAPPNQPMRELRKDERAMLYTDDDDVLITGATTRNRYEDGSHLYGGRKPNLER